MFQAQRSGISRRWELPLPELLSTMGKRSSILWKGLGVTTTINEDHLLEYKRVGESFKNFSIKEVFRKYKAEVIML